MAYTNNTDNATFYPFFTHGEFDTYRSQTSATEQVNRENSGTFTNGWSTGGQPGYVASEPISLTPEASFGEYDYSLLDNRGLTSTFLQSPGHQRRPPAMINHHTRSTTGLQLARTPSHTSPGR